MSQITNLNVAPYYDDFDPTDNYHRVLFKPGYPVQARELTTLQSILQNQIERFGQHFFKEGAKVIPGNTAYNRNYYSVELNTTFQGVPIDAYIDQLIGLKITGQTSGVTATVNSYLTAGESERGNPTIYVNYLSSSNQDNDTQQFNDGELLVAEGEIVSGLLGNQIIASGEPFASTIATNATSVGSAFSIVNGVYFIRGQFVNVSDETLVLDQYSNNPSYRIGLYINEEIVTPDQDESLTDNSQGYNNYAAPGADRLKVSCFLFKKSLTDFNDENFVELAVVENGILRTSKTTSQYSLITDELARRTYAESGDYYVTPFDVTVQESLDDGLGNNGIYNEGQLTAGGSIASQDLALYQVSAGKAFVKGYEIETVTPTFLDAPKTRTTDTINNREIFYNTGSTLKLNRVFGTPKVGIGNTYILSLRDERSGSSQTTAAGNEIGVARVYDFRLESGSYDRTNGNINQWNISLYDIQTTTKITLNENISLSTPAFIRGQNSNATAFLKNSVTDENVIEVYEKSGDFILNETFSFDGIDNSRVATAITSYSISDVKSVHGIVGVGTTFSADVIQGVKFDVGIATVTVVDPTGISTIVSTNELFPGKVARVGNLLQYSSPDFIDPVYAKIVSIGTSDVTVTGVTTVTGIVNGRLPDTSQLQVTDLKILETKLDSSSDNTLYTVLPKLHVSSVSLEDSYITIRKSETVSILGNQLSTNVLAGTNETFMPFDEERYSLIRSDGSTEILTSDKFAYIDGAKQLNIYNLGSNDSAATLTYTLKKLKPKSKIKRKNRVNSVVIDKSNNNASGTNVGSAGTTLNDGLTYGNYAYGTRVQDEDLSLNVSDILEVHAVYESTGTGQASAPTMILSAISGPTAETSDLIIGEKLIGQSSGAIAIVAEKITGTKISFIPKNQNSFREGEVVLFEESNIQGNVSVLDTPSFDISSEFKFSTGQKGSFIDYGYISRREEFESPSKQLKIYFSNGYYESTDDGDITTVQSYEGFDFTREIKAVNGYRTTDLIDIRPKTSDYTVSEGARSPFEFYGRTFTSAGQSASNILASDESLNISFSWYLPRVDRIFLTKEGKFQVKYGVPSEKLEKPVSVDNAIEIATITLPPYLYNTSLQPQIEFLNHKRYRMVDIKKLEDRIKNLEYYTSLSLLEANTANLFVPDSQGLNRFKSGFFVDNFTSLRTQETGFALKNSLDTTRKSLKPQHYTNSIDLIQGPVVGTDPDADLAFEQPEGVNIRKSSDVVTLDYAEVEWLKQTFATRTESVTPFLVSFWQGSLELTPATDTWIDTVRLKAKVISVEGNFERELEKAVDQFGVDPQTGFAPTRWNAWETTWTGQDVIETTRDRTVSTEIGRQGFASWGSPWSSGYTRVTVRDTLVEDTFREVRDTGVKTRTGNTVIVTEQFDQTSVGDRVVSRDVVPYMRSRNIQFVSRKLKPLTRLYAFFDGKNVTKYCVPKLLEISMVSGTFQVGETIIGRVRDTGLGPDVSQARPSITFRVAQQNHKEGPYDSPEKVYRLSPYNSQPISEAYSSTSNILNIDTFSLQNQPQGDYSGYVEQGMILVGQTSGAQATITNVRLISDISATLIGSLFIPDPNLNSNPRFEAGTRLFTLVNDSGNNQDNATTIAEEGFTSSGTIETVQENIVSVRNARIQNKLEFEEQAVARTTGSQLISTRNIRDLGTRAFNTAFWYDPLAQSFLVDDDSGIFLTKCDIFFRSKDDMDIPVTLQIRTMNGGLPTQKILPFSEVTLDPEDVNVSGDGSVATSFEFPAPVYLEGNGTEYAICVASNSTKYSVYISRVGENDLISDTFISNQPYLGSLFKSQNASTWEPSQWEDLKFTLYRADFIEQGSVEFYSPQLSEGNKQIANLVPNSLQMSSKKVRVALSTTFNDPNLSVGNQILQVGTNATATFVGTAGSATGTLNIVNSGIGYTGPFTFTGVGLTAITGSGRNATANIQVTSDGTIGFATISNGGTGYQIGDVLGVSTIGTNSVGSRLRMSVASIGSSSELILDNVQGDFATGIGNTVQFISNSGITTYLNYAGIGTIGPWVSMSEIVTVNDGTHIIVNHKNHGMYDSNNLVAISGAKPDVKPTKLTAAYDSTSNAAIEVSDGSIFYSFENVGVGTTNPGYLLIGDEVIGFTTASSGSIGGNITRGSNPKNYPVGTPVYKYELNGISLRRINKTHDLSDVTLSDTIKYDSYAIKLDMSDNGTDRTTAGVSTNGMPALYQNSNKSAGGYEIMATQNMPYEIITPMVQNVTVPGTTINATLRGVTGKSISGNEIPFIDTGFESVTLNKPNYLLTPRIICSRVNEVSKLTNIPGNKSLNLSVQLETSDTRLSPVIDTQRVNVILTSNRVNKVIDDYATDRRVNAIKTDPNAFQYVSKEINLENQASSIKIIVNASMNPFTDIRAFYAISPTDNFNPIFTPFPGYNNLNSRGEIINTEDSDGLPDSFVPVVEVANPDGEAYQEYTFTADQLPSFKAYRIKIVLTSTSQVYTPSLRDLRVIALA